ncbi:MAG TPA: ABC transporter ATP-binding protein [Clostridia bacterium]|nr:ABC transporter ATP-binding protein [Clostridia bacterium]
MMYSLITTRLSKRYLNAFAVDEATIALRPGKIYGLLGPNGSGKSTLMKLAAGLVHPTAGEVRVLDNPVGPAMRAQVAYMPTEPYFPGFMSVRQVGAFHADFFADFSLDDFKRLVEKMKLAMDMKVSQLSSGMEAKLKLAVAASRDARLLMLDEPLNGVDLLARDVILSAIIERAGENSTILISSHLIDVMESVLDEVIFLQRGRVVLQGEAEAVRAQYGKSIVDLYREVYAS